MRLLDQARLDLKKKTQKPKKSKSQKTNEDSSPAKKGQRLQKVLALAGIASRRRAEEIILLGSVEVNGQVVHELGTLVNPHEDLILVEGKPIKLPELTYYALNKPRGYLTTMSDNRGRPTVMDLLKGITQRVFPIGRLDYASEGLLLFTNDGDWAEEIIHPRKQLPRTYLAKIRGHVSEADLRKLKAGVQLADGFIQPQSAERIKSLRSHDWVKIELTEGKNLEVRRLFKRLDFEVDRLRRVSIGGVTIDDLPVGKFRELSRREINSLVAKRFKSVTDKVQKKKIRPHTAKRGK